LSIWNVRVALIASRAAVPITNIATVVSTNRRSYVKAWIIQIMDYDFTGNESFWNGCSTVPEHLLRKSR
jgi:hypothetical protein